MFQCQANGIVSGGSLRHQSRGGNYASGMGLSDRPIDSAGQAEIISINNEASHRGSVAGVRWASSERFLKSDFN
jgi:hypothetical protein